MTELLIKVESELAREFKAKIGKLIKPDKLPCRKIITSSARLKI